MRYLFIFLLFISSPAFAEPGHYAVVNKKTGIVETVNVYDPEGTWTPPKDYIMVPSENASAGWIYNSKTGTVEMPPAEKAVREADLIAGEQREAEAIEAEKTKALEKSAPEMLAKAIDALDKGEPIPQEAKDFVDKVLSDK